MHEFPSPLKRITPHTKSWAAQNIFLRRKKRVAKRKDANIGRTEEVRGGERRGVEEIRLAKKRIVRENPPQFLFVRPYLPKCSSSFVRSFVRFTPSFLPSFHPRKLTLFSYFVCRKERENSFC